MKKIRKTRKSAIAKVTDKAKLSMVRTDVIKARRKQLGLTQAEAADLAGMSTLIQWQKIESGTTPDPQISTVYRMAAALKVKPKQLLRDR